MKHVASRRSVLRNVVASWLTLTVAITLTACGSGDGPSNNDASSSGAGSTVSIDSLYAGSYKDPTGNVIAAPAKAKSIWYIAPGLSAGVYVDVADGIKAAAKKLGWKVTVFDGKFSPTTQLAGVQQAIAAGADGIISYALDCPPIKNGLIQAKTAGIPTVNAAGVDCDTPEFAHTVAYPGFSNYLDYIKAFGAAQADYVSAMTGGKANVILTNQTDLEAVGAQFEGSKAALAECSGCKVVGEVDFVGADFGPALQSKISQQLLKHPEANAFIAPYDAILVAGGAQALRSSGRLSKMTVVGGECSNEALDMIRSGSGMNACLGYQASMEGYGAVNYLVNIFAGKDPSKLNNGIGFQAVDKDHNLPAKGSPFTSPVDLDAVYNRLWGIK